MQRVRIGLTGLAFVFLLALFGAVFNDASDEEPITANAIEQSRMAAPAAAPEAEPKEPLAELGVAPGNADRNNADRNEGADNPAAGDGAAPGP